MFCLFVCWTDFFFVIRLYGSWHCTDVICKPHPPPHIHNLTTISLVAMRISVIVNQTPLDKLFLLALSVRSPQTFFHNITVKYRPPSPPPPTYPLSRLCVSVFLFPYPCMSRSPVELKYMQIAPPPPPPANSAATSHWAQTTPVKTATSCMLKFHYLSPSSFPAHPRIQHACHCASVGIKWMGEGKEKGGGGSM